MDNGEGYSDEEETSNLMSSALPVANLPKNADLTIPAATGAEYLSRVRLEASKRQTVVADIDIKKFDKQRTAQYFSEVVHLFIKSYK